MKRDHAGLPKYRIERGIDRPTARFGKVSFSNCTLPSNHDGRLFYDRLVEKTDDTV
jgi:hypothetical protein